MWMRKKLAPHRYLKLCVNVYMHLFISTRVSEATYDIYSLFVVKPIF